MGVNSIQIQVLVVLQIQAQGYDSCIVALVQDWADTDVNVNNVSAGKGE